MSGAQETVGCDTGSIPIQSIRSAPLDAREAFAAGHDKPTPAAHHLVHRTADPIVGRRVP